MQTLPETLPENIEQLKTLLLSECYLSAKKDLEITDLKSKYQLILEQFQLAQKKQFGKSREISQDQLGLFNELEEIADVDIKTKAEADQEKDTLCDTRKKPKRKPLPKDLPRETIVHDIRDEDKICNDWGHELHKMGEEKSEQLDPFFASAKRAYRTSMYIILFLHK